MTENQNLFVSMIFIYGKGKKGKELPKIRERFEVSSSGRHDCLLPRAGIAGDRLLPRAGTAGDCLLPSSCSLFKVEHVG